MTIDGWFWRPWGPWALVGWVVLCGAVMLLFAWLGAAGTLLSVAVGCYSISVVATLFALMSRFLLR